MTATRRDLAVLGRAHGWLVRLNRDVLFMAKGDRRLTIWLGTVGQIVEVTHRIDGAPGDARAWSMGSRDRGKWEAIAREVQR